MLRRRRRHRRRVRHEQKNKYIKYHAVMALLKARPRGWAWGRKGRGCIAMALCSYGLYTYGPIWLWPYMVIALYSYGPIWLWPYIVMAVYSYGPI